MIFSSAGCVELSVFRDLPPVCSRKDQVDHGTPGRRETGSGVAIRERSAEGLALFLPRREPGVLRSEIGLTARCVLWA